MSFLSYLSRLTALLSLSVASLFTSTSQAEPVRADIQLKAGFCINCHSATTDPVSVIPSLLGRPATELRTQLMAFKAGSAPTNTIMTRLVSGFSDEDLAAIALYLSQQTPSTAISTNEHKK